MISQEQLLEYLDSSAQTYHFLSTVFIKELARSDIKELEAGEYPSDTGNAYLDEGYRQLRTYFRKPFDKRYEQLRDEFEEVFLKASMLPPEAPKAMPYESVFTSPDHMPEGPARDDCVKRYREDGFAANPELRSAEDHLSVQLEYLSVMNGKAAEAARAHDKAALKHNEKRQLEFIEQHLLDWVPQLRKTVQDLAKTPFYVGMLYVVQGALEQSRLIMRTSVKQMANVDDSALDVPGEGEAKA